MPWGVKEPVTSSMGESLLLTFQDRSGSRLRASVLGTGCGSTTWSGTGGQLYPLRRTTFQKELTGGVYELVRPKAETVGTVYADLDGDGSDETVRLCVEETVEPDGSGVPLVTSEAALRPYRLETEVDGHTVACPLGDAGERYEEVERLFVTADRAGAPVVVAGLREEGASGALAVYALSWEPETGSFVRLEAPEYSIQGLLEGTTAHVVVPETRKRGGPGSELVVVPAERPGGPEYGRNGPTARSTGAGRRNLRRGTGGAGDPGGPAPVERGADRKDGLAGDPGDLEGQRAGGGQPIV